MKTTTLPKAKKLAVKYNSQTAAALEKAGAEFGLSMSHVAEMILAGAAKRGIQIVQNQPKEGGQ